MTNAELEGFRKLAGALLGNGPAKRNWNVVALSRENGKLELIHAFGLTRERAEDWLEFFPGGSIVDDEELDRLLAERGKK